MEYIIEFIACAPRDDGVLEEKYTRVIKGPHNTDEAKAIVKFIDSLEKDRSK